MNWTITIDTNVLITIGFIVVSIGVFALSRKWWAQIRKYSNIFFVIYVIMVFISVGIIIPLAKKNSASITQNHFIIDDMEPQWKNLYSLLLGEQSSECEIILASFSKQYPDATLSMKEYKAFLDHWVKPLPYHSESRLKNDLLRRYISNRVVADFGIIKSTAK